MKIIDEETAARWGREAEELDDGGSVLAGRPPGYLSPDERHERLQARMRWVSIAAGSGSILLIFAAYAARSWPVLIAAAGCAAIGVAILILAGRAARAFRQHGHRRRRATV